MMPHKFRPSFFPYRFPSLVPWCQKQAFKTCVLASVASFVLMGFMLTHVRLLINHTPSLPYTYFLYFPHLTPHQGDLTVFEHVSGMRMIKRIIGLEGDTITYDKDGVLWVSGTKVGKPKEENRRGEPLVKTPSGVIAKGHVFLYAPHAESLDSRYTSVGLVYEKHLGGRAYAIF